jgi:hypothetical protein
MNEFNIDISERDDEDNKEIKDFLKCPICFENIKNPKMCFRCKKIFCFQCLKHFYETGGHNCPLCKALQSLEEYKMFPKYDEIINYFKEQEREKEREKISSTYQNINQHLLISKEKKNNLRKSYNPLINKDNNFDNNHNNESEENSYNSNSLNNENYCQKHSSEYIFYCIDCSEKLCGYCVRNFEKNNLNQHLIHNVFKIKDLEQNNFKKIYDEYQQIEIISNIFNKKIKEVEKNISYLKSYKNMLKENLFTLENHLNNNNFELIKETEKLKTQITNKQKGFESEIPQINNTMKSIMRKRELEGYKKVMNILQSYNSNINDINISNDLSKLRICSKKIEYKTFKEIIKYKNTLNFSNYSKTIIKTIEKFYVCINFTIAKNDLNKIVISFKDKYNNIFNLKFLLQDPNIIKYKIFNLLPKKGESDHNIYSIKFEYDEFVKYENEDGNIVMEIEVSVLNLNK